jgi:anti-sigma factor RsiW
MSDCEVPRADLLDAVRGRLSDARRERFERHLEGCPECQALFERERELDRALDRRPSFTLPEQLRDRLTARVRRKEPKSPGRFVRWVTVLGPSLAAAALALLVFRGWYAPNPELVGEAVNDHLRVVYAEHPIEIESGGIHQVKPWFTGRLDFAPAVTFSGDEEFPMLGGAVGLFVDRKAATFVFKHRLHTLTLFVFRSEGLGWSMRHDTQVGSAPATSAKARGFNVLLWREGDLGYALVSDAEPSTLARLAGKLATTTP